MFRVLVCAVLLVAKVAALSDEEIEKFETRFSSEACNTNRSLTTTRNRITLESNSIPDHPWGCSNPHRPLENDFTLRVPRTPSIASGGPYCLPRGSVGMALNGVPFFGPTDSDGTDAIVAVTRERFDACSGHSTGPNARGECGGNTYHYHKIPSWKDECNKMYTDENIPHLIGVAGDGFPIYSQGDIDLDVLDECHGYTEDGNYRYVAALDGGNLQDEPGKFPYVIGCYKGLPVGRNEPAKCENMEAGKVCVCEGDGVSISGSETPLGAVSRSHVDEKDDEAAIDKLLDLLNIKRSLVTKRATCDTGGCFDVEYGDDGCDCLPDGDTDPICVASKRQTRENEKREKQEREKKERQKKEREQEEKLVRDLVNLLLKADLDD